MEDNNFINALQNAYPTVHDRMNDLEVTGEDLAIPSDRDAREIFDHVRDIKDPEHPFTLEQLGVVDLDSIKIDEERNLCFVEFTPTIPHCSMATLIGLTIKVHLMRILPLRYKVDVQIAPGTHAQEAAINKQLSDKERVAAALENRYLLEVINECLTLPEEQEVPSYVENLVDVESASESLKWKYILRSRQPVKSYRRWSEIMSDSKKKL